MLRSLLCVAILLTTPALPAAELSKADVIEKLIHHYGGAENLRKLDNMSQSWTMATGAGKGAGTDVRQIAIPGRLRVELTYPDRREIRLLNGDRGYQVFDRGAPRVATTPLRDAMRLQLLRLYSPLMLQRRLASLQLLQEQDRLVLQLEEAGIRLEYGVDLRRWEITEVTGVLRMNGSDIRFLTRYSDFRMVDGVLVHHHEEKFAGNVPTASLDLQEIR